LSYTIEKKICLRYEILTEIYNYYNRSKMSTQHDCFIQVVTRHQDFTS